MERELATLCDSSILGHLEPSSRRTYRSGTNAFKEFADRYGLADDAIWNQDRQVIMDVFKNFALFLRHTRHVKAETIDEYTTHVLTDAREHGLPLFNVRSPIFGFLIRSWSKIDRLGLPDAHLGTIPCAAAVFRRLIQYIPTEFKNPDVASLYKATVAFAYALGLRPCSYTSDGEHTILGDAVFAVFDKNVDAEYPITDPSVFPPSVPIALLVFQKSSKNAKGGYNAPFIIAQAPRVAPFCLVTLIVSHLRRFPPRPRGPAISGAHGALSSTAVNHLLKNFAPTVGLDPSRFSATSFRVGHTVQTDTLSDFEQMRDTGHFSKSGKIAYLRASLQQAQKTAQLLTDTEYHTLPMVKLQSGC